MLILVNLAQVNNRREINYLECQEKLVGQRNQKFCCDYCRNTYNNRQNKDANAVVRKINSIFRKIRRILSKLNPKGKKTVHLIDLAELKFNFHYYINSCSTKNGHQYFFCYDMGYRAIENQEFLLVHKQKYVS